MSPSRRPSLTGVSSARALLRQAVQFLFGSCLGLTADLVLFAGLTRVGAAPWMANVVSSGVAVTVTYVFVSRYAFNKDRSRASYAAFVTWYAFSITAFSILIELASRLTPWAPFTCKLASLPLSFSANFLASRLIFRDPAASSGAAVVRPATSTPG